MNSEFIHAREQIRVRARAVAGGGFVSWLVLAACAGWAGEVSSASEADRRISQLYARCQEACLEVLVEGRHAGSGWFARPEGVIVTAAHIFKARQVQVEVVSPAMGRLACSVGALDRGNDVVLLRTRHPLTNAPVLPLARTVPTVGEEIFQFGSPLFRAGVLQPGRVARPDTVFEYYRDHQNYVEVVHVSAMMQAGTSGGPWVNRHGEVVGLQSGLMSLDGKPVGIAYLTPAAPIGRLLKMGQDAATPDAGFALDHLWEMDPAFIKRFPPGIQGLVASSVRSGGPAERAGIKARDVIITAEGRAVSRISDLVRLVRSRKPAGTLRLRCLRADATEPTEHTLTLDCAEVQTTRLAGQSAP